MITRGPSDACDEKDTLLGHNKCREAPRQIAGQQPHVGETANVRHDLVGDGGARAAAQLSDA